MCTVLINDNNCPQSQHTSKWIMKLPGKYLEDIILMVSIASLKWFIFCQGMNTYKSLCIEKSAILQCKKHSNLYNVEMVTISKGPA